jgi:hypothetical protein
MAPETSSATAALTPNSFTRSGYSFSGWNTVAAGGGTAYPNDATYPFTASGTLYAEWTASVTPPVTSPVTPPITPPTVSTHTSLTLSRTTVRYGSEHAVEFIIRVTPRGSQRAFRGVVKIKVGSRIVCQTRVSSKGVARCALPARALRLGNYRVVAIYGGDSNAHASTSVVAKLKIN